MPVYILLEGETNYFKIGRAKDVDARIASLRAGNPRPLALFDQVITSNESVCETFFHRRLRSRRLSKGGGREFYEAEAEEMRGLVADFRAMFEELQEARNVVAALVKEPSSEAILEPTPEDRRLQQELARNKEEREFLQFECELIESRIKRRIGTASGLRGIATFKTQLNRKYDEKVFRKSMPEMYESLLEKYYCLDTTAWKKASPREYESIQTTYYSPSYTRPFKLI